MYKYKATRYEPQTGQGVVFVQYIDTFFKLNTEAGGYTEWFRGPEDDDRYVENFFASEGIRLEKDPITRNGQAKLCLYSMWGKLTDINNRTKWNIISNPHQIYRFLAMPDFEIANVMSAIDDEFWASCRFIAEEESPRLRNAKKS